MVHYLFIRLRLIQSDYVYFYYIYQIILYLRVVNKYTYELGKIKLVNILVIYKFLLDNSLFSDGGIKYMVAFSGKFRNTSAFT